MREISDEKVEERAMAIMRAAHIRGQRLQDYLDDFSDIYGQEARERLSAAVKRRVARERTRAQTRPNTEETT